MTSEEAAARRADRLRTCQVRAQALGFRVEATPGGFVLLSQGPYAGVAAHECGLPEIEQDLEVLEAMKSQSGKGTK